MRLIHDFRPVSGGASLFGVDEGHQGLSADAETGLVYNRAVGESYGPHRYLHVTLGRFTSPDPHPQGRYVDGMNGYEYVRGGPVGAVDPLGLECSHSLVPGVKPGPTPQMVIEIDGKDHTIKRECCVTVNVVVKLSSKQPSGSLPSFGHAGVGVGDDFYDLGPSGFKLNSPAEPWWSGQHADGDGEGDWSAVRNGVANQRASQSRYKVVVYSIEVERDQADRVTRMWKNMYRDMRSESLQYTIPGVHCSSATAATLEHAGLLQPLSASPTTTPDNLAAMADMMRNTCGPHKGELATVTEL